MFSRSLAHDCVFSENDKALRLLAAEDKTIFGQKDSSGETPLALAVRGCKFQMVNCLLEIVSSHLLGDLSNIGLVAVRDSNLAILKLLVYQRINLNHGDLQEMSENHAIIFAMKYRDIRVLNLLLDHPTLNLDVKDSNGMHIEEWAEAENNIPVASRLLRYRTCRLRRNRAVMRSQTGRKSSLQSLASRTILNSVLSSSTKRNVEDVFTNEFFTTALPTTVLETLRGTSDIEGVVGEQQQDIIIID